MTIQSRQSILPAVLGGVIAGVLDIGIAAVLNGVAVDVILRTIARGLLGAAARTGGAPAAALGFGLQVLMGALIGAAYGGLWVRGLGRFARVGWVGSGLVFGAVIFVVMNYVVVPLSAIAKVPHFGWLTFSENMAAMLVFGLIIAFSTRMGFRTPAKARSIKPAPENAR